MKGTTVILTPFSVGWWMSDVIKTLHFSLPTLKIQQVFINLLWMWWRSLFVSEFCSVSSHILQLCFTMGGELVFPLSMAGVWENLIIPLIQQDKLFSCPCSSFLADTHRSTWNSGHTDTSFSFQQAFFQCCRVILGQSQPHGEPT